MTDPDRQALEALTAELDATEDTVVDPILRRMLNRHRTDELARSGGPVSRSVPWPR